jgi:hypothetical protein
MGDNAGSPEVIGTRQDAAILLPRAEGALVPVGKGAIPGESGSALLALNSISRRAARATGTPSHPVA